MQTNNEEYSKAFNQFFNQAIETLLWSEEQDDKTLDDIEEDCLREIMIHAESFFLRSWYYVEHEKGNKTFSDLGHDYILTINGHGAGFWETYDWPIYSELLTKLAECYPPIELINFK